MPTAASTAAKPDISKDAPQVQQQKNPFDTVFDGNDTDDEWWEEDDTPDSPNKVLSPTRSTHWPKPPTGAGLGIKTGNRLSTRVPNKRYSVQKPSREKSTGRQKKQNARAGIKLVTNLTRPHATAPVQVQPSKTLPHMGNFVDLAALQALTGESSQTSFWKSRKQKESAKAVKTEPSLASNIPRLEPSTHQAGQSSNSHLSPHRMNEDLSPNDRPIVIGLSIPSRDAQDHTISPQTASSDTSRILRSYEHRTPTGHTPETPTIIITPAQEVSLWSMLDNRSSPDARPRPASSVYSQAVHGNSYTDKNAPPVPQVPASALEEERLRLAGLKSYFSPDSDDASIWEDEVSTATRLRVVSTCTVFEEDETPINAKAGRARSLSAASRLTRNPSMSTIRTRRLSTGWWNYITTPFMTRSNTFAMRGAEAPEVPALPSLAIAATKAHEEERNGKTWEKQFSPLTPETTTTSISSERWWNDDSKDSKSIQQSPVLHETRHKVQTSAGTLPIVLSETAGLDCASMLSTSSGSGSQLHRDNTTSTFHSTSGFSTSDREVPVLLDAPNTRAQQLHSYTQPQLGDLNIQSASRQVIQPVRATVIEATAPPNPPNPSSSEAPPPPYSPSPARIKKYRVILPPGHALENQYPASPGPVSPGLQAAMTSQGAIPMSNVPLTPPQTRRPINLNSGYPTLPVRENYAQMTTAFPAPPSKKAKKAEAKRQRHEKEEAAARRAGGLWRGRGCIPNRGCYGRGGAEGRKRRRWYLGLIVGFLSLIILVVVLATQLARKSSDVQEPSQWLNLTGFPPIFTGLSTVAAPANTKANTGCVFPSTQWSCTLPKELQPPTASNPSNQPNFLFRIQWDNSSSANETFANVTRNPQLGTRALGGSPVSARAFIRHMILKARQAVVLVPDPEPPAFTEEFFLGNTTDGIVSDNKAGEPTPFYISLLPMSENTTLTKRSGFLDTRQSSKGNNSSGFPDLDEVIPAPSLGSDGNAAPANLLPTPKAQPIRLYDRGLPTEHYGFYTYYDRSIFLKSITRLNETNLGEGTVPDDENGGARESEAKFRCTWSETRFLVQMWTRRNGTVRLLNSTSRITTESSSSENSTTAKEIAELDFSQPGTFPYPITITIDRHGGNPEKKMLYCYEINDRRGFVRGSGKLHDENRGFAGTLINGAPGFFRNTSDPSAGGFDGGNGGCGCGWKNFEEVIRV